MFHAVRISIEEEKTDLFGSLQEKTRNGAFFAHR
jgi:hypothetical protein